MSKTSASEKFRIRPYAKPSHFNIIKGIIKTEELTGETEAFDFIMREFIKHLPTQQREQYLSAAK